MILRIKGLNFNELLSFNSHSLLTGAPYNPGPPMGG